ncbi:hypothetical protein DRW42_18800 [Pedobacter miscanthi]|uniref:MFS transporter n=2 Tax=Pedobacter miscanthi TaxID=2259170 RepID=A0A366KRI8_9SPHI|nr:hypothetical protein DRW42_18800 [Pedobacter miscanthi]
MLGDMNKPVLKDFEINPKIKLSALWAAVTLCYLYGDYFELYVPHKVRGLISGNNLLNSPSKLLAAAVLLAIPALMVFISIVLKPRLNRILNIFFGLMYSAIMILIACTSLTEWRAFYVFLAIVESIITILIVRYAFTWPRE